MVQSSYSLQLKSLALELLDKAMSLPAGLMKSKDSLANLLCNGRE